MHDIIVHGEAQSFWVKVPKTGTKAYRALLFPGNECICGSAECLHFHTHSTYRELAELYGQTLPGFSVVRHPVTRFRSALNHLLPLYNTTFADTEALCDFLEHSQLGSYVTSEPFLEPLFDTTPCTIPFSDIADLTHTLFMPQMYWAYHPQVTIFHYENLPKFNSYLATLGYDTSTLQQRNVRPNQLAHIDFTHSRITSIVERLYRDDYEVFGYPLTTQ